MASLNVGNLGEYLREQRRNAQLSLRQLADAAGVSNPYLSQIERGLRKPSAEVLQQVAKALRISAETLYVRAGILDAERDGEERLREGATHAVILADPSLNERQKQALLQIYESFRKENGFGTGEPEKAAGEAGDAEEDTRDRSGEAGVPHDAAGPSGTAVRGDREGGGSDAGPRRAAG
ncbi:helix-turn-helix transcriptional regulator [Streptomyces sp. NPDC005573]|uniref:helix-turn-helix domain-containing protein n=1 Tax=unclassified Streptomyces TaxID=2593676 RepID=UPI0033A31479